MVTELDQTRKYDTMPPRCSLQKISPGPFWATKLWGQLIQQFQDEMPAKKHWRHMKSYKNCFVASDAVDFLHMILKSNRNIGKEMSRLQTIKLLQKFHQNSVFEDVQGGSEEFGDNNRLYRFSNNKQDDFFLYTSKESTTKANDISILSGSFAGFASNDTKETIIGRRQTVHAFSKTAYKDKVGKSSFVISSSPPKRSFFTLSNKETAPSISVEEENNVWRNVLIDNIKETLRLQTFDDLVTPRLVKGEWINHNVTKVGKSGVVRSLPDQDLPSWITQAMCSLAHWPLNQAKELTYYKGIEKDMFKVITNYYCTENNGTASEKPPECNERLVLTKNHERDTTNDCCISSREPLLTFGLYDLFTNILWLIDPQTKEIALKALRLSLLLLPPSNRRKLHFLLKLMFKVSMNPSLRELHPSISTRCLVLQTFSHHILSYFEEVHLHELFALRLVSFLMDNHEEVMRVPSTIAAEVEERLIKLKQSKNYSDGNDAGSILYPVCDFPPSDFCRREKVPLKRSKSADALRNFFTFTKPKNNIQDLASKNTNLKSIKRLHNSKDDEVVNHKQSRKRFGAISKTLNATTKLAFDDANLQIALSCPDISRDAVQNPVGSGKRASLRRFLKYFK